MPIHSALNSMALLAQRTNRDYLRCLLQTHESRLKEVFRKTKI